MSAVGFFLPYRHTGSFYSDSRELAMISSTMEASHEILHEWIADDIDEFLTTRRMYAGMTVNRDMLHISCEGWVHLNVDDNPENPIFSVISNADVREVVLVWENSD